MKIDWIHYQQELPFIVLLSQVIKEEVSLSKLVENLPKRFTSSDRIQDFPIENAKLLLEEGASSPQTLLKSFGLGNLKVLDINTTDGLRLTTHDNTIIHLRPSGNAPELRCYVETDNQQEADKLVIQVLGSVSGESLVVNS